MKKIARVWSGSTRAGHAEEYLQYLLKSGIPALRGTEGNQGVMVLRRTGQETAEFTLISFWESRDDIRAFAGDDINKAVYFPEDKNYLLRMEPELKHFEVVYNEDAKDTTNH